MPIFWSIFLGILQGLTEFLPVSSSGHLVIAQSLIPGFSQPGIMFDVMLHAGTLLSVVFFFRKELLRIDSRYIKLLIIGTIPAVIIGFLFEPYITGLFESTKAVGLALLITAVMNFLTDKSVGEKKKMSYLDSFAVGVAQAFAISPGVSRSGSTIFAASKLGYKKEGAAKFSFLLSIPAVAGANVLQFVKYGQSNQIIFSNYLLGFLAALISGYFAIKLVFNFLEKKKFKIFAYYCLFLGLVAIFLS